MVKLIFYIVVALLVLSYFGISLQHLAESPTTQSNFGYFWSLIQQGWSELVGWLTGLVNGLPLIKH
jgi:hypothetical protein